MMTTGQVMRELAGKGLTTPEIASEMNARGIDASPRVSWTATVVAACLVAAKIPFKRTPSYAKEMEREKALRMWSPGWDFSDQNIETGHL
jgi:hypothetical protein